MNQFHLYQLLGVPQGGDAATGGGSFITTLIPFALIIVIFYFFIIRPQNKKQKETQRMLSALKKGDKVVTIGGIHGAIEKVKESTVVIRVDDNAKLEFSRSAISSVTAEGKTEKIEDKKAESEEKDGETAEESKS
ncbi:preprotein translocase subunit YajC [Spirochaetia bacterium]|nr:preprotein translocase subunit YajC [Spirochaetia bacterium]